jgi:hypothetical protein
MEDIKSKTTTLSNELSKVGEAVSKATQNQGPNSASQNGQDGHAGQDGNVRDADFEEKK